MSEITALQHSVSPLSKYLRNLTNFPARVFTILGIVVLMAISVIGYTPRPGAVSPLAGTWTLVAADRIGSDEVRRKDYGENPTGRLIVDAEGRYSAHVYSDTRPRFASGDKSKGTPEEYAATVMGMSTHFGTIAVDEAAHTLRFQIEHSAYANWEGTEQVREYVLDGDDLSYRVPASASGNGSVAISVWRRLH